MMSDNHLLYFDFTRMTSLHYETIATLNFLEHLLTYCILIGFISVGAGCSQLLSDMQAFKVKIYDDRSLWIQMLID